MVAITFRTNPGWGPGLGGAAACRPSPPPATPAPTTPLRAGAEPVAHGDGFREIWSHRRLTRYLVRADLKKHGSDTLLGNIWWVLDPLLQMVVYVVLVQVIFQRRHEDYPLFVFAAILPWKWFSSAVNDGITSVTSARADHQAGPVPEDRPAGGGHDQRRRQLRLRLIPLIGLMLLFYQDRISPYLC